MRRSPAKHPALTVIFSEISARTLARAAAAAGWRGSPQTNGGPQPASGVEAEADRPPGNPATSARRPPARKARPMGSFNPDKKLLIPEGPEAALLLGTDTNACPGRDAKALRTGASLRPRFRLSLRQELPAEAGPFRLSACSTASGFTSTGA